MIRWLVILGLMAGGGTAQARDLALLKIRLDRYEAMYMPPDCKPEPGMECIPFFTFQTYRATLLRTYAGAVPHRAFTVLLIAHAGFGDGAEFYVVAEPALGENRLTYEGGGDVLAGQDYVRILDRAPVSLGFCLTLDDDETKADGLAAAADTLRRDHPCKER